MQEIGIVKLGEALLQLVSNKHEQGWENSRQLYTECKYGGPLGRRPGRVKWKRG